MRAFRLAHFTDIHITSDPRRMSWKELRSKRLAGWVNLRLFGRHAALRDAPAITRALVEDLESLAPDHVLFTGDVTGLALASEFEEARAALEPFFAALLPAGRLTGIPGNHDLYVRSALRERLYERHFEAWEQSDLPGAPPIVRLLGERYVLLCLKDSRPRPLHDSSGLVGREQLAALGSLLGDSRLEGRIPLLALHYGLRRADGSPDTLFHRLRDAEEVLGAAARGGVRLVLHGHLHDRFVLPPAPGRPFVIANPGSLTHRSHERAYHIYELVPDGTVRLEARRFDGTSGRFEAWRDAPGGAELPFAPAAAPARSRGGWGDVSSRQAPPAG